MATGSATCLGTAELTPSSCSVLGWDRDTGCGIRVGRAALHPACLSFPIGSGRAVGTVGAEGRGVHCLQRGAAGRRGVGQEVGRRHEALPCAGCGIGSALVPCTAWTQQFPSVLSALSGAVSVGHKAPCSPHCSIPQFPLRSQPFLVALLLIPTPHKLPTQPPPLMLPPHSEIPQTPGSSSQRLLTAPRVAPWHPTGTSPLQAQHPNRNPSPTDPASQ